MTDLSNPGDGIKLPGGLGDTVSGLCGDVISAGAGGTATQAMVDRANEISLW